MKQKSEVENFDRSMVAGIVILYNPNSDVIENIKSYLNQVALLFIVDNSENENLSIKDEIELEKNACYIFNNANIGVAAALNIGAKKAIEQGYSFLLTMDQDSKAPAHLVSSLLNVAQSSNNVGIVSPLHANKYGTHIKPNGRIEKTIITMTSGNLISLEAFQKLGNFNEDLFIDYVDIEYCFRMYCSGYNIYRLNEVILDHSEANLTEVKILNKKIHPHNHKPFRWYYKTRNLLLLRKMYKSKVPNLLKNEYSSYLWMIARMLVFEKNKFLKLKMIWMGILDYLKGKSGKRF